MGASHSLNAPKWHSDCSHILGNSDREYLKLRKTPVQSKNQFESCIEPLRRDKRNVQNTNMAHQAHSIPWNLLATNFEYYFADTSRKGVTNLYPLYRPNQAKDLNCFVAAFCKTIDKHVLVERNKYPQYEAPEADDVVISDQVARKIIPTVHRFRRSYKRAMKARTVNDEYTPNEACCHHEKNDMKRCGCPLPPQDRKMSAFLHRWQMNACYKFWNRNEDAFLGLETVKTLLLHGEMDSLLHICSHHDVDYADCWIKSQCYDTSHTLGWGRICDMALKSYVCLNVLYCYPKLWDDSSGRTAENDYRWTSSYQRTLRECTEKVCTSNLPSFPHRQFYGIGDDQFAEEPEAREQERWGRMGRRFVFSTHYPYGILSIDRFLELEKLVEYQPTESDVVMVHRALTRKGLPMEIVLMVMQLSDYSCRRRLPIPHDPLHPSNYKELHEYLAYCWLLMVHCDVMARELGSFINWNRMITNCIIDLWGIVHWDRFYHPSQSDIVEFSGEDSESGINGNDGYSMNFV
jgi:hypothetical protein